MIPTETQSDAPAASSTRAGHFLHGLWPFWLYFAAILLAFFRTHFYFFLDEYAAIWRQTQSSSVWQFIFKPHNEHCIPLFHLFWAFEVLIFGEHYTAYIVVNGLILALVGFLWQYWLRRLGVSPALAIVTGLVGVTCLSQADNIMAAWQSGTLLAAACLICIFIAYDYKRLKYVVLFSFMAALLFSSTYVVVAAMAAYLLYDYFLTDEARYATTAAGLFALFGFLLTLPALAGGTSSGQLMAAVWQGPTLSAKLGHLAWLAWYTLGIAFYGPISHLLRWRVPQGPSDVMTVLSLMLIALMLFLSWNSRNRDLIIKLLIVQLGLFVLISPFRSNPTYVGYSGRYYTLGLIPWVTAAALVLAECLDRFRVPVRVAKIILGLLLLLAVRNVRCAVIQDSWFWEECGRAARLDYFLMKDWLRLHAGQSDVPNISFSPSVAPWLDVRMLVPIYSKLDQSFIGIPRSIKSVTYLENTVNTRGWGPILDGHPATQTFRVPQPSIAARVDLLVSRYGDFKGLCQLSILDDTGAVLWTVSIPADLWPENTWIGAPINNLVRLDPQRTYSLQVASTVTSGPAPTVWMNDHLDAFPGSTRTPEGANGVFCFRLALAQP